MLQHSSGAEFFQVGQHDLLVADDVAGDLGSRPYARLRPNFVPASPFLVIKDKVAKTFQILVEPHLIDAEFRMAWMPFL